MSHSLVGQPYGALPYAACDQARRASMPTKSNTMLAGDSTWQHTSVPGTEGLVVKENINCNCTCALSGATCVMSGPSRLGKQVHAYGAPTTIIVS